MFANVSEQVNRLNRRGGILLMLGGIFFLAALFNISPSNNHLAIILLVAALSFVAIAPHQFFKGYRINVSNKYSSIQCWKGNPAAIISGAAVSPTWPLFEFQAIEFVVWLQISGDCRSGEFLDKLALFCQKSGEVGKDPEHLLRGINALQVRHHLVLLTDRQGINYDFTSTFWDVFYRASQKSLPD